MSTFEFKMQHVFNNYNDTSQTRQKSSQSMLRLCNAPTDKPATDDSSVQLLPVKTCQSTQSTVYGNRVWRYQLENRNKEEHNVKYANQQVSGIQDTQIGFQTEKS